MRQIIKYIVVVIYIALLLNACHNRDKSYKDKEIGITSPQDSERLIIKKNHIRQRDEYRYYIDYSNGDSISRVTETIIYDKDGYKIEQKTFYTDGTLTGLTKYNKDKVIDSYCYNTEPKTHFTEKLDTINKKIIYTSEYNYEGDYYPVESRMPESIITEADYKGTLLKKIEKKNGIEKISKYIIVKDSAGNKTIWLIDEKTNKKDCIIKTNSFEDFIYRYNYDDSSLTTYKYDKARNLTEQLNFKNNLFKSISKNKYDIRGNLIENKFLEFKNCRYCKTYKYGANNKIIEETYSYPDDTSLSYKKINLYDNEPKLIGEYYDDKSGVSYMYNQNGLLIEKCFYKNGEKDDYLCKYRYAIYK
jgi:hypothetical protein